MTMWTIGYQPSGRKIGCVYASTFSEACTKLGYSWRDCYTIRCD